VNLGPLVNSSVSENHPSISADGLSLYFDSNWAFWFDYDICVVTRVSINDDWGIPEWLGPATDWGLYDLSPNISSDGLTLFFEGRSQLGDRELLVARRRTRDDYWESLVNLGPSVNTTYDDCDPSISSDGYTLYFCSSRLGGVGNRDLWQVPIIPIVDLNGDGNVDLGDFCKLAQYWGQDESSVDIAPGPFGDWMIDFKDLAVLAEHWLEISPVSAIEDFETADFSKFPWEHTGDASWAVTPQQKHSGAYSTKAGSIDHNETTTLQVGLDCGSGNITFFRKVSCEAGLDNLKFYIDGVERGIWSGEEDWAEVSFGVTAGRRTFRWTYSKGSSGSEGDDTAWIDDIVFPIRLDRPPKPGVIEVTDATFNQIVLSSESPVLVDFWAPWCGPCLAMAPVIEEIADEYAGKAKVCKLNVDEARNIPMEYSISAIPTFILFNDGQIQRKWVGVTSKQELTDAIDDLL